MAGRRDSASGSRSGRGGGTSLETSHAAGLAPDLTTLLAARLAQGADAGAGLAAPAALALLGDVGPHWPS